MADLASVVSVITGVIGAVTGTISLIQVRKIKSQDLRSQRGRLVNRLQVSFDDLSGFANKANQSRTSRFAAEGLAQSGVMQRWIEDFERVQKDIEKLSKKFLELKIIEAAGKKLETQILELHLVEEKVKALTSELRSALAEDDRAREQLAR